MTRSSAHHAPAAYRLRVVGHLDQHWSPWFGALTLTHEDDGTTTLACVVSDQAELHGVLAKIRDLGLTLVSVVAADLRAVSTVGSDCGGDATRPPGLDPHVDRTGARRRD